MIQTSADPRGELLKIAAEYRHQKTSHADEGERSGHRRRIEARLAETEARFESLVARWVEEEEDRSAWRAHLHKGSPPPREPEPPEPPVFKGRTESGSVVEIRQRRDGGEDVLVDGSVIEHREGPAPDEPALDVNGQRVTETFQASAGAIASLRAFLKTAGATPPWERARELLDDGLIDVNFGLTARGRRALAARRR